MWGKDFGDLFADLIGKMLLAAFICGIIGTTLIGGAVFAVFWFVR
jgi:hypothetical protein